uniref:Uncharacterized protein n=1 Tax=Panagrolaimus sp. PS1159 TaxID=55785 RepID=A0AC35GLA3_9BILA
MSTKNEKYSFIEQSFTASENRYYNLNLNQNEKGATLIPVQSNSKLNNDKYCVFDNYEEKEKLWDKSSKASSFTTLKGNFKKRWKNENILNITNKSTLSLHIAAYENSFETVASDLFDDENIVGLKKEKFCSIKTSKQCFTGSLKFRNPFEFPRQQNEDQRNKSEIMQFKESQQLLLLAEDLTPQAPPATTTLPESERLIQENWWILVVGIFLMIFVGAGLLFLGYKCSGENRTRKSEKESRRVTTLE